MLPDDARINCVREAPPEREAGTRRAARASATRTGRRRARNFRPAGEGIGPGGVTRTWTLRCCQMHSKGAEAASTLRPRNNALRKWRWTRFARFGPPRRGRRFGDYTVLELDGALYRMVRRRRVVACGTGKLKLESSRQALSGRKARRDNPVRARARPPMPREGKHRHAVMLFCAGAGPGRPPGGSGGGRVVHPWPVPLAPPLAGPQPWPSRRWPPAARARATCVELARARPFACVSARTTTARPRSSRPVSWIAFNGPVGRRAAARTSSRAPASSTSPRCDSGRSRPRPSPAATPCPVYISKTDPIYRRGQMSDLSRIVHARRHRRDLRQQQPTTSAGAVRAVSPGTAAAARSDRSKESARSGPLQSRSPFAPGRRRAARRGAGSAFRRLHCRCCTPPDREHAGGTRVDAKLNRRDALPPE